MIVIQEIEKRGLDIIGLYRLCGSETKKKMLREAFETNPEAVDLSSENVPDINVITSETPMMKMMMINVIILKMNMITLTQLEQDHIKKAHHDAS